MANSIEIFQNTLLKLIVRSGTDSDRRTVTLDSGELGYTTDAKRLFVGDGTTPGGNLVGNVFNGSRPTITSDAGSPMVGDLAYSTSSYTLYRLLSTDATQISNWEPIGGVYRAANNTINISTTNTISVCAISAYNISQDALGKSLTLDSGRITLSSTIETNTIKSGTTFLALPSALQINTNTYKFPSNALSADTFLATDASGNLRWSSINTFLSSASARVTLGSGLTATVNGTPTSNFSLITSSNVTINGLFLPTAHATFMQSGSAVRSVGIASIVPQDFTAISSQTITIYGQSVERSTSRFDYPGVYGYLITTANAFNPASVVIDVTPKNASYAYDKSNTSPFRTYGPTVTPYYKILDTTQILVIFYVAQVNTVGELKPPIVTPGYNDPNTRFSITIYG